MNPVIFVDIFRRPRAAFQGALRIPPENLGLIFFAVSLGAGLWFLTPWMAHAVLFYGRLVPGGDRPLTAIFLSVALKIFLFFFWTGTAHLFARVMDGRGTFRQFLSASLLISIASGVFQVILTPVPYVNILPSLWAMFLSVLALSEVHGLSVKKSALAAIITWFIEGVLITALLIGLLVAKHFGSAASQGRRSAAVGLESFLSPAELKAAEGHVDGKWMLKTLGGKSVAFSSMKGKTTLVNFWATWCGPCRAEMPSLQRLYEKTKTIPGFGMMLVTDEDPADVAAFLEEGGYTFPVYISKDRPKPFESSAIPVTFLVSPDGDVRARCLGAALWDGEETIAAVLSAGKITGR